MKYTIRIIVGLSFVILFFEVLKPIRKVFTRDLVLKTVLGLSAPHVRTIRLVDEGHPTGFYYKKADAKRYAFQAYRYVAPLGLFFLIPGFFIIVLFFKWRPIWFLFFFHLIAGLVATVVYILGVEYSTFLLSAGDFLINVFIPAVSLAWVPGMYAVNSDQFTVNS